MRDATEDEDDFAVWPFRRQLVDPLSHGHEPLVPPPTERPPPGDTHSFGPVWAPPARRRSVPPTRFAVPLALATFFAAIAGAAAIANRGDVQSELKAQIKPTVAQAAPRQKKAAALATPVTRRARRTLFVPDVVGLERKAAVKQLKLKKFHVRVKFAKGAPDTVIEQTPHAATEVRGAGKVLLIVGRQKAKHKPRPKHAAPSVPAAAPVPAARVIVAGVVGLSRADATRTIANEGLTPAVFEVPSSEPAGTVVAQAPAGGTRIEAGSRVRVNVSAGP